MRIEIGGNNDGKINDVEVLTFQEQHEERPELKKPKN